MFGPETPMMRERLELNDLPHRIQIRSPMRIRTLAPARAPRIFKVEAGGNGELFPGYEDAIMLDIDDDPFDFESEIAPVPPDVIRDLAANAIRDAQSALKQLAADGVV